MTNIQSPINHVSLRNPGESLFWKIMQIFDGIEMLVILVAIMGIFTAWEWVRWFREVPPNPIGSSILFGILCVLVVIRNHPQYPFTPKRSALFRCCGRRK